MTEELSLPCRYKVSFDPETFIYSFTTKNLIEYQVAFIDNVHLFKGTSVEGHVVNVYSLNIEKLSKYTEPLDLNVQQTVACIVVDFFKDTVNSLMYSCDGSDAKEQLRMKKFSKWYDESLFKEHIIKRDEELGEDPVTYVSLLYHKQNPLRTYIEKGYTEIIDILRKPQL